MMLFYSPDDSGQPPNHWARLSEIPPQQYLTCLGGIYYLADGLNRHSPLTIDFSNAFYQFRGGTEYLPKALRGMTEIGDCTAGWGRDGWLLAYRGFQVTLYERNPYLAFLLQQGLLAMSHHPVAQRLKVVEADSCAISDRHEALYLDPMYPERKKSAKVGKEMQALHLLLTDPQNPDDLLEKALLRADKRVVVKRPKGAPHLANRRPNHTIDAPNTRYDVYLC